jgi:hypothetical protein
MVHSRSFLEKGVESSLAQMRAEKSPQETRGGKKAVGTGRDGISAEGIST